MPTDGGRGIAQLYILVSRGTYDKLRQRARRESRADEKRLGTRREESEARARRELHLLAEQRQAGLHHDTRNRR